MAELLVAKGSHTLKDTMIKAGYSVNTAKAPTKVTESKGFKQLCDDCGLTDNLILKSLQEDIEKKPQRRVQELFLGAKIKGMLIDRQINANVNISFDDAFKE